eukprot:1157184-Pelagomonas_calceolata.AAC.3
MPTWKCEIIGRTINLMKEIQQRDPSDQATVSAHMPEVFTCEAACIYNTNGKCIGMLRKAPERLLTLLEAYEAAKKGRQARHHPTTHPGCRNRYYGPLITPEGPTKATIC